MLFCVISHRVYPLNMLDVSKAMVAAPYRAIADSFHCVGELSNHFASFKISL